MCYTLAMKYIETTCQSAARKIRFNGAYGWDLNIYRGCAHKCQYCFAQYFHKYLDEDKRFFENIYIKTNVAEHLERQLSSPRWKREAINIGGVTDSYQPCEKKYELMPEILRMMIKYKNPIIISTKSKLILRDYDLIAELAEVAPVNIASTIVTAYQQISKKIEPGAFTPDQRFEMLKAFSLTKASTGLHMMPMLPFLTDDEANLDKLLAMGKDAGVNYVLPSTLRLRGDTRKTYFAFIKREYPGLYADMLALYKRGGLDQEYRKQTYERLNRYIHKYGISREYRKVMERRKPNQPEQLSFL